MFRRFTLRRRWTVRGPGDLVELDTLDIRPVPGKIWKQFTARDVVSRWDTIELGRQATAQAAAAMLDHLAERMPVRAISIDNGSEFIADFEAACQELEAFQDGLRAWQVIYNTIRPHEALRYRTPAEYLASVGVEV